MRAVRYRFPRSARLRKRADFLAVQSAGRPVQTRHFVVLVSRVDGAGRLGITVSKKIGNAVTRNRLKRRIREFVRQARSDTDAWVPPGCDVVIVAKRSAASIGHAELARDLERARARVASC